ncbi:MAG: DUF4352 domain-containing protein [Chloroflexi bacterium]|nr:DUF4352 domain-containing protein [Chloroflexota bacterium]
MSDRTDQRRAGQDRVEGLAVGAGATQGVEALTQKLIGDDLAQSGVTPAHGLPSDVLPGRPVRPSSGMSRRLGRRRALSGAMGVALCAILAPALAAGTSADNAASRPGSGALGRRGVARQAIDLLPQVSDLPPGFVYETGGLVDPLTDPALAAWRQFVSLDGGRRVTYGVFVGESPEDGQTAVDARLDRLTRFDGWSFTGTTGIGDEAYRGIQFDGPRPIGYGVLLRIEALAASVLLTGSEVGADPRAVDGFVVPLVVRLAESSSDTYQRPHFVTPTVQIPGVEPPGPPPAAGSSGVAAGAAAPGSTTGTSGTAALNAIVGAVDRPWTPDSDTLRPASGYEFMTVDMRLENQSSGPADYSAADFAVTTADGARWSARAIRRPFLNYGQVLPGVPVRGYLTFEVPVNARVTSLVWQASPTQTLTVPL